MQQPPATVVLEACDSAHYWTRQLQAFGHMVRLLPAHDVRPYMRCNKTDSHRREGCANAATRHALRAQSGRSYCPERSTSGPGMKFGVFLEGLQASGSESGRGQTHCAGMHLEAQGCHPALLHQDFLRPPLPDHALVATIEVTQKVTDRPCLSHSFQAFGARPPVSLSVLVRSRRALIHTQSKTSCSADRSKTANSNT